MSAPTARVPGWRRTHVDRDPRTPLARGARGRNRRAGGGVIDLVPISDGSPAPAALTSPGAAAPAAPVALTAAGTGPAAHRAGRGTALKAVDKDTTAGILFGIGAYGLWGLLPLYFFVLQPGRRRRNRGQPGGLVPAVLRPADHRHPVLAGPRRRVPEPHRHRPAGPRRRPDRRQLADLHLRRDHRPGRRNLAGLLHQPAGLRPAGRLRPEGEAAAAAVGRRRHRFHRGGRTDLLLRQAAVDCPDPGVQFRPLRLRQEARGPAGGRHHQPHGGNDRAGPDRRPPP